MRQLLFAGAVLITTANVGLAQRYCHNDQCDVCRETECYAPRECCAPPQQQAAPAPQGAYVAPTPQGEAAGESESFGLRFGALRIPECTIRLPTIQLPHLIHLRRQAEMYTEGGVAPYVERPLSQFEVSPQAAPELEAAPAPKPQAAPPCCVPPAPAACAQLQQIEMLEEKLALLKQHYGTVSQSSAGSQAVTSGVEQHLRQQLVVRERELSQLYDRFDRLEAAIVSLQGEEVDSIKLANSESGQRSATPHRQYRSHSYTKAVGHEQTVRPHTGNSHSHNVRAAHHHHHHAPAARPKPSRTLEFLGALRPSFDWIGSDD